MPDPNRGWMPIGFLNSDNFERLQRRTETMTKPKIPQENNELISTTQNCTAVSQRACENGLSESNSVRCVWKKIDEPGEMVYAKSGRQIADTSISTDNLSQIGITSK